MAQIPRAIDLFVCQNVIYEACTGNITIVNRFRELYFASLPAFSAPFYVFALLNDGQGDLSLELVVQRPDDLTEILRISATIALNDPLSEGRCLIPVARCHFQIEGAYHFSLLADSEPIADCRLEILLREP